MLLSVVVLSFNSGRHLGPCLDSLLSAFVKIGSPCEVFVVENGSSDGSVQLLEAYEKRHPGIVTGIYSPVNLGTTVSRNLALRRCHGEHVLILDSDARTDAECILHLIEQLRADPGIGLIAPRLLYADGRYQLSVDQFPTFMRKLQRLLALRSMERRTDPPPGLSPVDYAISAFWLVSRQTIERVGLLDEKIFYSPEDVDYCVRVWLSGLKVVYCPAVSAVHDAQELSRSRKLNSFVVRHASGLLYYFFKYGCFFSAEGLRRRIGQSQKLREKLFPADPEKSGP